MITLTQFGRYISAMTESEFNNNEIKVGKYPFRKLYNALVREFDDIDKNLKRWLLGKPCIYFNDKTNQWVTVEIGRDTEALYYFLAFCKKLNNQEEVSEEFTDYLALLISRSLYSYEEC